MQQVTPKTTAPGFLTKNALIFNPVLAQAAGLCPIIAVATSFKNSAILSLTLAVVLVATEVLAGVAFKKIPRWVRIGLYIIIGALLVTPVMVWTERRNAALAGSIGMYLPLIAVNSLVVMRCERYAVKLPPVKALRDAATAAAGYAGVTLTVGIVREILGSGMLGGVRLWEGHTMPAMLLPFGGFLLLGFAAALQRMIISERYPAYLNKKSPKALTLTEKQLLAAKHRETQQTATAAQSAEKILADISAVSELHDYSAEIEGEAEILGSFEQEMIFVAKTLEPEPEEQEQKKPDAPPVQATPSLPRSAASPAAESEELEDILSRSLDDILSKDKTGGDK